MGLLISIFWYHWSVEKVMKQQLHSKQGEKDKSVIKKPISVRGKINYAHNNRLITRPGTWLLTDPLLLILNL